MRFILFLVIILFFLISNMQFESFKISRQNLIENTVVRIRTISNPFEWAKPYITKKSEVNVGSGFFVNDKGYIVTNYHVIKGGTAIMVSIPIYGKKVYDCDLISIYPYIDLAILKIRGYKNKHYLKLGDSNLLKPFTQVFTAGYPLAQNTYKITAGIISGFQDGDIQIDSPINAGNSGGPLLNKKNEVIGINYMAAIDAENVGFSIPINYLKIVLNDMLKRNTVIYKNILGATFNNSNKSIMNYNKNICKGGYYISYIYPNSTLDNGVIKAKNIICEFNGLNVDNYGDILINNTKYHLIDYIKLFKHGETIKLKIIKNGKLVDTHVVLKNDRLININMDYIEFSNVDYQIIAGLCIMELKNNHLVELENINLEKYRLLQNKTSKKLVISDILEGSSIHSDNIFIAGDILTKVNNIKVYDMDSLRFALTKKIQDKFISFETELGDYYIIDILSIKKDELKLSKQLKYRLNNFVKKMLYIN